MSPWGCRRRSGELSGVVEVKRESRKDVYRGRWWVTVRGMVSSLPLLGVGEPAGEKIHNTNIGQSITREPSRAIWKKTLRTHFNKWNLMETYPKGEKGGALCSVLSPKPKSDLKNRTLSPTILIVLL